MRRLSNLVSDAAMTVRRLQGLSRFPDDRPLAHLDIAGAVREAASAVSTQMLADADRTPRRISLDGGRSDLPPVLGLTPEVIPISGQLPSYPRG